MKGNQVPTTTIEARASLLKGAALATTLTIGLFAAGQAGAATMTVSSFDPVLTASGQWFTSNTKEGGAASIVELSGNPATGAPLPTGAAKLTTGPSNKDDKAEASVRFTNGFGTVRDFLSGGSFRYSFFKDSTNDLNASASVALKIEIKDSNISVPANGTDGFATFVFEPTWNQPGSENSSAIVPTDIWTTFTIDADTGLFWQTGIYNEPNQAGGGLNAQRTIRGWADHLGDDFLDADLTQLNIGIGSNNLGQTGYFDDVRIKTKTVDKTFDFEAGDVPEPASLALLGLGLAGLAVSARRRRRA